MHLRHYKMYFTRY